MKYLTPLLFGALMISLLSSFTAFFSKDSHSDKKKIAYQITANLSRSLQEKYGLHFMGISEEAKDGKYETLGFELSLNTIISKDEGRALLINTSNDILNAFNNHPEFKKHMTSYPFTNDNIIINIYIRPSNSPDVYHPNIAVFSLFMNEIEYSTKSPEKKIGFYAEERESFETALKLVNSR